MERERVRAETLYRRDRLTEEARTTLSRSIVNSVANWIQSEGFDAVMLYLSMKSEVATFDLLDLLLHREKMVCAPIVDTRQLELTPRRIRDPKTELVRHPYGMLEPNATCPTFPISLNSNLLLYLVSLSTHNGYRLGYGKGFYDRFLVRSVHTLFRVGLAYQMQIVEDTFPQTWDVPVQHIFTENGTIVVSGRQSAVS